MSEHTREPWAHDGARGIGAADSDQLNGGYFVCIVDGPEWKANARRIVACVNWCAGNDTEGMENAVSIGRPYTAERDSAIERELALTKQRDELLAALKVARSEMPSVSSLPKTQTRIGDVIKAVDSAIAKAEA